MSANSEPFTLYQGSENTPEGETALREGRMLLERQFAAERQAVRQTLTVSLEKAIKAWYDAANAKEATISAVAPASAFFLHSPALDVTDAVMREMDKEQPVFHELPTVTVRPKQAVPPQAPDPQGSSVGGDVTLPEFQRLQQGEQRHLVQSGDTLHRIGARYSVSPEAIMLRNKLSSPNLIIRGSTLIIPGTGRGISME